MRSKLSVEESIKLIGMVQGCECMVGPLHLEIFETVLKCLHFRDRLLYVSCSLHYSVVVNEPGMCFFSVESFLSVMIIGRLSI